MTKPREILMIATLLSAAEAYILIMFFPQLRPTGGLGRLGFRLFLLNTVILFLSRWYIYPFTLQPLRNVPGPTDGSFFIGHGPTQFSKPPGKRYLEWMNTIPNNGLLYFRGFFNRPTLLPTSHETLKTVLSDNSYDYIKPAPFVKVLRRILGDGLILVEGSVHKFQRKHLVPSFQVKHIKELYPMFWAKSCEMTNMLVPDSKEANDPRGFELEFGEWCMRATLDIIGIAGFGRDFNALKNPHDEFVAQYTEILEPAADKALWFAMNILLGDWFVSQLPWDLNRRLNTIQKNLYDFALNLSKGRRDLFKKDKKAEGSMNDILSLLVKSNDFTDDELAHQVLTMMAAGHETTSSALSWCTYLLAKYPEMQQQVRDEVRQFLPSPDNLAKGETITAAQIDALPLLNGVCNETTRLYPTVPVTARMNVTDTYLGGHKVPKDTMIILSPWAINRSEHFWGKDATEFKPERWINANGTPNNTGGADSNFSMITFLHGPRSCIGQGFAKSELKCLLASVVGRYEFHLAKEGDSSTYFPAGLITTKPQGGMWLRMKRVPGW